MTNHGAAGQLKNARKIAITILTLLAALSSGCADLSDSKLGTNHYALLEEARHDEAIRWRVRAQAFMNWLEERAAAKDAEVDGLFYAYFDTDNDEPWFLSPAISGSVARFYLRLGDTAAAIRTADALLRWQHPGRGLAGERLAGAFPSQLERGLLGWQARYLYDSGDSLAVMTALVEVYEATGEERFLIAAERTGRWLDEVMCHGEAYGVWAEPHGVPMMAVTDEGNFDNRIAMGRMAFWLPALHKLSQLSGDPRYAAIAVRSLDFAARGQADNGGFFDHFDPGYPPRPYALSLYKTYNPDFAVVADDSLRAALAAWTGGKADVASRFAGWLEHDAGRLPGYITLPTGDGHFPPGNTPYYDVVASGLYRSLAARAGLDGVEEADAFLARTQGESGGWIWGRVAKDESPISTLEATITGVWALVDLIPGDG